MADQNDTPSGIGTSPSGEVAAPVTPAAAVPPPKPAAPALKGAEARRAAALEVAISDPAEVEQEVDGEEEAVTEPAKGEEKKVEEPKKEDAPDALAARAQADRYLQGERRRLDEERAAFAKERETWESSKKDAPDPTAEVGKVHRMVAADIVEYADQQKWTPQQRHAMAMALGWSSQPEEKRPAGWRGNGQGQVLSEVQKLEQRLAEQDAKIKGWEESQTKAKQEAETRARSEAIGNEVLKSMPAEGVAYARAFAEHSPEVARSDLATLAQQMVDAEHDAARREYRDPKQITAPDVLAEYDRRWKELLDKQYGWAEKVRRPAAAPANGAPKVPTAKATASPSNGAAKPASREERRKAALEALPEDLDR